MIEKIERQRGRYIITEHGTHYQLHQDIFLRESLAVGETADLAQLEGESMVLFAVEKGMQYALSGLKSVQQVYRYLLGKQYSESCATEAVERLQEYRLLDDEEYAKTYIAAQQGQKGQRYLRQKLYEKGIQLYDLPEEEPEAVLEIIIKRYGAPHKTDPKEHVKIQNFLLQRGFSYDTIKNAIKLYEKVEY